MIEIAENEKQIPAAQLLLAPSPRLAVPVRPLASLLSVRHAFESTFRS